MFFIFRQLSIRKCLNCGNFSIPLRSSNLLACIRNSVSRFCNFSTPLNEFKVDFSILQQQQVIKDIQDLETKLTNEQKANGQKEAEKLLGRPLKNVGNLYKTDI